MVFTEKQAQRKAGSSARRALTPVERKEKSEKICRRVMELEAFQRASRILIYAAFGAEVSLDALAELAGEKELYYPVCLPDWQMVAARPLGAEGWEIGAYGIRTPILERSQLVQPEELDLILVPCTGFDSDCRRVGMGKGYYDRYLARCTQGVKVGIAFECQRLERVVTDQYDQPLDSFVTERMIYHGTIDK
jgi:5-formyltetrahydrofolate cyclo-ligase